MHEQQELFDLESYTGRMGYVSIYDPAWDSYNETQSTCESVGEQVKDNTKKSAPQQYDRFSHWVEEYWVERRNKKYWYFRYMWMDGRKLKRKYLGSVNSTKARRLRQVIELEYIRENLSPSEILTYIDAINREWSQ